MDDQARPCRPVGPVASEAEAGGSQVQDQSRHLNDTLHQNKEGLDYSSVMEHFLSTGLTLGSMSNIITKRGSEDGSLAFSSFTLFPFLLGSYNWPLTGSRPPASSSQAQGFQACSTMPMPSYSGQFFHSFEFYVT